MRFGIEVGALLQFFDGSYVESEAPKKISRDRLQFAEMYGILLEIQMIMKCVDKEK